MLWRLGMVSILLTSSLLAASTQEVNWEKAIYVAADGSDIAAGTKEQPLATIMHALALIPSGGGVIALRGGTYREAVGITPAHLPALKDGDPLLITAVPGEKVIFDGSAAITEWHPLPFPLR